MSASFGCAAIILISTGCKDAYRQLMQHRTAFLSSQAYQIANRFPMSRF